MDYFYFIENNSQCNIKVSFSSDQQKTQETTSYADLLIKKVYKRCDKIQH